jgi:starch synthase (maltosyl-transferring)
MAAGQALAGAPPRIYTLFGSVARDPSRRSAHLSRIAKLGFDWVCWSDLSAKRDNAKLAQLAREAEGANLKLILETSSTDTAGFVEALRSGVSGFLATAAGDHAASDWRRILDAVRAEAPSAVVAAEALGRPWDETLGTAASGFDYMINSAAWWDLRQAWFLRQQHALSGLVATLASPEPLHGSRLAHRLMNVGPEDRKAIFRAHYLLASVVSSGIICPMGYEVASAAAFDGAAHADGDWDAAVAQAPFDLSDDIARINRLKASAPVLAGEGRLRLASAPGAPVLALVRTSEAAPGEAACLLVNATSDDRDPPPLAELAIALGSARLREAFSGESLSQEALAPHQSLLLFASEPQPRGKGFSPQVSRGLLDALAPNRVVIERVTPELDGGRFAVKRVLGESLAIEADIFSDGHDRIAATILYRPPGAKAWREAPLVFADNDRWAGEVQLTEIGRWTYSVIAWRETFETWRQDVARKHAAGQSIALELIEGKELVERARDVASLEVARALDLLLQALAATSDDGKLLGLLESTDTAFLMRSAGLRTDLSRYQADLEVVVDRPLAAFAAWYELMPRSQSGDPLRHGTFDDVIARIPYVRDLGFDVLYFPPIHPIGATNRKGRNNSLVARADDPGSPYAIGSEEGGHDAMHSELGGFAALERLIKAAKAQGLEIALDFAIQCSPDHPWIKQHPEWFEWRPDGSIRFAENPPKKYEDIVNVHFYGEALPALWFAWRDVVRFWIEKGVTIFRVDNPHTKPVPFWEWLIRDIQEEFPQTIFLAEAFTRPKMMRRLAKIGFTQSYSYFTWRDTKAELTEYLTELTESESVEYMRPNFFTNTPDINPVFLQKSGRAGFQARLVLAAMLNPLYGIYNGFELAEAAAIPGKEEYLNSEKYEIKAWDWDRPGHIKDDIRRINRIRRNNPALWRFNNLTFLNAWNDNIIAFYKMSLTRENLVVVAVNLDPHNTQAANFEIPLWEFGLPDTASVEAVDLTDDRRLTLSGKVQHVSLDPLIRPYAIWRLVPPADI